MVFGGTRRQRGVLPLAHVVDRLRLALSGVGRTGWAQRSKRRFNPAGCSRPRRRQNSLVWSQFRLESSNALLLYREILWSTTNTSVSTFFASCITPKHRGAGNAKETACMRGRRLRAHADIRCLSAGGSKAWRTFRSFEVFLQFDGPFLSRGHAVR